MEITTLADFCKKSNEEKLAFLKEQPYIKWSARSPLALEIHSVNDKPEEFYWLSRGRTRTEKFEAIKYSGFRFVYSEINGGKRETEYGYLSFDFLTHRIFLGGTSSVGNKEEIKRALKRHCSRLNGLADKEIENFEKQKEINKANLEQVLKSL